VESLSYGFFFLLTLVLVLLSYKQTFHLLPTDCCCEPEEGGGVLGWSLRLLVWDGWERSILPPPYRPRFVEHDISHW
jgi:hypothetical protein